MANSTNIPVPQHSEQLLVDFPAEHVLLLTMNRPKALNAMTPVMEADINNLLNWFDEEPSLWVCIVTGTGRAFCAGADLVAWNERQQSGRNKEQEEVIMNVHGFGALSRRMNSSKPIIAAVNGSAFGGGVELILNCDLVVASEDAKFALPEVKRGVIAIQGGIPRLVAIAGRQLASEMLLLGRTVSASEAYSRFGFVNVVVPHTDVIPRAVQLAKDIVACSPDAVQSTKRAVVLAMQNGSVDVAAIAGVWSPESKRTYAGKNIKEGLKAFTEKRNPKWTNPAKL